MVEDAPARRIYGGKLDIGDDRDRISPGVLDFPEQPLSLKLRGPGSPGAQGTITPLLHEHVKATLSPRSPIDSARSSPRPSGEFKRRSSEVIRRSQEIVGSMSRSSSSRGRERPSSTRERSTRRRHETGSPGPRPDESSDSYVHSLDREADSASVVNSIYDTPASGSQILKRSDLFHSPTIQRHRESESTEEPELPLEVARRRSEDFTRSKLLQTEIRVQPPSRSQTQHSLGSHTSGRHSNIAGDLDSAALPRPSLLQQSNSSQTLQDLVKAGSYPLQRAAGFAGYLKNHSKRMSSMLASGSMGYIEKVSGMWVGARRHYNDPPGLYTDDGLEDPDDDDDVNEYGNRFRAHFALPSSEKLQATYFGYLHRVLPIYGKVYVSDRSICFRSLLPGTRTKVRNPITLSSVPAKYLCQMILPLKNVENVDKEKASALVILDWSLSFVDMRSCFSNSVIPRSVTTAQLPSCVTWTLSDSFRSLVSSARRRRRARRWPRPSTGRCKKHAKKVITTMNLNSHRIWTLSVRIASAMGFGGFLTFPSYPE